MYHFWYVENPRLHDAYIIPKIVKYHHTRESGLEPLNSMIYNERRQENQMLLVVDVTFCHIK